MAKPRSRKSLGKLAAPKALDRLAAFVGKHAHGSLGWFPGVRIDRLAGPAAKSLPAAVRDSAITLLQLSEGARICALATGATPIVLLHVGGKMRLLPSLASFVLAWSKGNAGVLTRAGSHALRDGGRGSDRAQRR